MIVDHRIWESASVIIEREREDTFSLLRNAKDIGEVRYMNGFLDGLAFFEQTLIDAKKPKHTEEEI